jgi:hypothetical protein
VSLATPRGRLPGGGRSYAPYAVLNTAHPLRRPPGVTALARCAQRLRAAGSRAGRGTGRTSWRAGPEGALAGGFARSGPGCSDAYVERRRSANVAAVDHSRAPVDPPHPVQAPQQLFLQPGEDARALPLRKAAKQTGFWKRAWGFPINASAGNRWRRPALKARPGLRPTQSGHLPVIEASASEASWQLPRFAPRTRSTAASGP